LGVALHDRPKKCHARGKASGVFGGLYDSSSESVSGSMTRPGIGPACFVCGLYLPDIFIRNVATFRYGPSMSQAEINSPSVSRELKGQLQESLFEGRAAAD